MADASQLSVPLRKFDWLIYLDGTLAGLSALIPVPVVDWCAERLFRGRMPTTIAWRNQHVLRRPVIARINRGRGSIFDGCLTMPFSLAIGLLKSFSRKIVYFLSVKGAADNLGHYWHRAFLIDYAMRRGDLDHPERAEVAAQAIHDLLSSITTSPLTQLATEVIRGIPHIFLTLWRWIRRRKEDTALEQTRERMATAWSDFDGYFIEVALQYEAAVGRISAERDARRRAREIKQAA